MTIRLQYNTENGEQQASNLTSQEPPESPARPSTSGNDATLNLGISFFTSGFMGSTFQTIWEEAKQRLPRDRVGETLKDFITMNSKV